MSDSRLPFEGAAGGFCVPGEVGRRAGGYVLYSRDASVEYSANLALIMERLGNWLVCRGRGAVFMSLGVLVQ